MAVRISDDTVRKRLVDMGDDLGGQRVIIQRDHDLRDLPGRQQLRLILLLRHLSILEVFLLFIHHDAVAVISIIDDIAGTRQRADVADQRHGPIKIHIIYLHPVHLSIIDDPAVVGDDIVAGKSVFRDLPGKGLHAAAGHRHEQIACLAPARQGLQIRLRHFLFDPQRPVIITCQYSHCLLPPFQIIPILPQCPCRIIAFLHSAESVNKPGPDRHTSYWEVLFMANKKYRPGMNCEKTGKYSRYNADGKCVGEDIDVEKGRRFPPAQEEGCYYKEQ